MTDDNFYKKHLFSSIEFNFILKQLIKNVLISAFSKAGNYY